MNGRLDPPTAWTPFLVVEPKSRTPLIARLQVRWIGLILAVSLIAAQPAGADESLDKVIRALESGERTVKIVAFGDSITGVYYHTGGRRAWADMLQIALEKLYPKARIEMTNAGKGGNTSRRGLLRIDRDVLANSPDLVVVMFGMNDVLRRPPDDFRTDMKAIISRCREAGAAVVLSTPNSVYPNPDRPMTRLAECARIVRDLAKQSNLALADSFQAYEDLRAKDVTAWRLLMNETIHPNMNGHKYFAETMAEAIAGRPVSLDDVPSPDDSLRFTLARLREGLPVKIVAMPPYDMIVPNGLKKRFPEAKLDVVTWPAEGKTLAELEAWSAGIRKMNPNLVVVAVPPTADAENEEAFLRRYQWILACCLSYGKAQWDLLPILPSVTAPLSKDACHRHEMLARQVIAGTDCRAVDRQQGDNRPAEALLAAWIERCAGRTPQN